MLVLILMFFIKINGMFRCYWNLSIFFFIEKTLRKFFNEIFIKLSIYGKFSDIILSIIFTILLFQPIKHSFGLIRKIFLKFSYGKDISFFCFITHICIQMHVHLVRLLHLFSLPLAILLSFAFLFWFFSFCFIYLKNFFSDKFRIRI